MKTLQSGFHVQIFQGFFFLNSQTNQVNLSQITFFVLFCLKKLVSPIPIKGIDGFRRKVLKLHFIPVAHLRINANLSTLFLFYFDIPPVAFQKLWDTIISTGKSLPHGNIL